MNISIDKSKYFKFWQSVNPKNETFIHTSKIMKWIKTLMNYEEQLILKKKVKREDKRSKFRKDKKELNDQRKHIEKIKLTKNKKSSNQQGKNNQIQSAIKDDKKRIDNQQNSSFNKVTDEVILDYIQRYLKSAQYKLLAKEALDLFQAQDDEEKEQKQKLFFKRKLNKLSSKLLEQPKYDQSLISLSYEQCIFFYYWFKKTYEKDQIQLFQQKIKQQNQSLNQDQSHQSQTQNHIEKENIKDQQKSKCLNGLSQKQFSDLKEESFISLNQHQPKFRILFNHYAKLSHQFDKKTLTFDELKTIKQMITLHKWMVFCKEWDILQTKSINDGWVVGKVTRQFLMDVYYKNSFYRKQMPFQMFQRALIDISFRMYQDCDLEQSRPIDLMLGFLLINDEEKFLQNLEIKKIKYRPGEILECFKKKDRDVHSKMVIVKVSASQNLRRSESTIIEFNRFGSTELPQQMALNKNIRKIQNLKVQSTQLNKIFSQNNIFNRGQLNRDQEILRKNYSNVNVSKVSSNKNQISNHRKSAPQIGVKLPSIQNNKYFQKIPNSNHLNKFRHYIQQEIPDSSSVLKNKITGYHKIHQLHHQDEELKMHARNKLDHDKISRLIGNKLENIFERGKVSLQQLNQLQNNTNKQNKNKLDQLPRNKEKLYQREQHLQNPEAQIQASKQLIHS